MKVVHINGANSGSIGRIISDIMDISDLNDYKVESHAIFSVYNGEKSDRIHIVSTDRKNKVSRLLGQFTGYNGCFAKGATKRIIEGIEEIKPDIVHLHNLHDGYVNLKLLFSYLQISKIPVVWTLHDCWAFTAKCPYFERANCLKWKTGCYQCPAIKDYPRAMVDHSVYLYKMKRDLFTSVERMQIITPSAWLEKHVRSSYLGKYPIKTIYNGINTDVFQRNVDDRTRVDYGIGDKQILLGVASPFDYRKGIDIFQRLVEDLDCNKFQIVLIGLNEEQVNEIDRRIIRINRTSNIYELVKWYSVADVFVNPTREEVLGMTNIEAQACGTPVITFNSGGSPECVDDSTGIVVERDNYDCLLKTISSKKYSSISRDNCIARARMFSRENMVSEYVNTYEKLLVKF